MTTNLPSRFYTNKELIKVLLRGVDDVAEGITIADARQPDLPLVFVNKGFKNITGYSSEEVIGKNCRFLQGPDTDESAIDEIRKSIKNNSPCVVELLNYRKDGEAFWNRLSFIPIFDGGRKITHYLGIQSDITRQKELLKEESELNAMKVTLQTVNDIVFNFMNNLQLINHYFEEEDLDKEDILEKFNSSFNDTLQKLQRLNALEKFKEKDIASNLKVIDTE